jgi:hypothetical protein
VISVEQFTFIGSVKDNQPYAKQKVRLDKRRIREIKEHFTLEAGTEFELLNKGERGDLYEIRIIADNPYLQVLISIDDWLVESFTIAELLAQPGTGRLLSNFQAIAGETPAQGYTLSYNPDIPESYFERIKITLKCPLDSQNDYRSNPGKEIYGRYDGPQRVKGVLPLSSGGKGGFVIQIPTFGNTPNIGISAGEGPVAIGGSGPQAVSRHIMMTSDSAVVENSGEVGSFDQQDIPSRRGVSHGFVGLAGLFTLNLNPFPFNPDDDSYSGAYASTRANIFFDNITEAHEGAGLNMFRNSPARADSHTDIYICDTTTNTDFIYTTGKATPSFDDMVCIRDGDRFYFPGVVTHVEADVTLPTKFAKTGSSQYSKAIHLRCSPGFRHGIVPPTIVLNTTEPDEYGNSNTGIFTVRPATSTYDPGDGSFTFDTAPKIRIIKAEVKRHKFISYDG